MQEKRMQWDTDEKVRECMSTVELEIHVWKEFTSFCSNLAKSVQELFAGSHSHTTDKSVCFFIIHRHLTTENPSNPQ